VSALATWTHPPLSVDELAAVGRQRAHAVRLTNSQARVLGALHAHAFFTPHCCPSQRLLAEETGLTREWVNRICRELWLFGLICWAKARRLGSRFDHNRYTLRNWIAGPRARMLALLDRIRRRRPLHTERTTRATEDRGGPETWSSYGLGTTATRARGRPPDLLAGYEPKFDEVDW
jgi:hypothetical protein